MKRTLSASTTLLIAGLSIMMIIPIYSQTQSVATSTVKKPVVFACNMKAMTPAQRKRHAEVLSPALQTAKLKSSELPEGYAFDFPSDAKIFQTVAEWVGNERLCCPFFDFDIHVGDDTAPMTLKITGPDGVKQFIKAELPGLVG
jgi:hypothetical protein